MVEGEQAAAEEQLTPTRSSGRIRIHMIYPQRLGRWGQPGTGTPQCQGLAGPAMRGLAAQHPPSGGHLLVVETHQRRGDALYR